MGDPMSPPPSYILLHIRDSEKRQANSVQKSPIIAKLGKQASPSILGIFKIDIGGTRK